MALRPDPNHVESPTSDGAAFGRQRTVRVVVGTHLDELVARKTGTNPAAIVAVEREALVLGQLRHPNVVDLVRAEHGDGSATIVTQYAGPTTLEQERPGDAADVARTGAALLTVVGELHSMGWIHGRLRAEHCIVGDDGRLTLCALGAAHRIEPRDPRRGAEIGDAVQIISMLAERVPAPTDRTARHRLRQLHAALAAAGDDRSPASVERLRVSLTRLSGSVAVAGTRTDPSTTRPSDHARARLRRDDTTRASAVLPQRRSWRGALVATAGLAVLFGGAVALLPVYAKDILQVGPAGLGILSTAPAIGSALAGLAMARFGVALDGRLFLGAVGGFGLMTVVFGASTSFPLSLAALVLLGGLDSISVVLRQTVIQHGTPDSLRGRVAAVNRVFISSSNELGALESGLLAALTGPVVAVVAGFLAAVADPGHRVMRATGCGTLTGFRALFGIRVGARPRPTLLTGAVAAGILAAISRAALVARPVGQVLTTRPVAAGCSAAAPRWPARSARARSATCC